MKRLLNGNAHRDPQAICHVYHFGNTVDVADGYLVSLQPVSITLEWRPHCRRVSSSPRVQFFCCCHGHGAVKL